MEKERRGVLGFTAKVLNEAGGALVDLFELGEGIVENAGAKLKKAPEFKQKARDIVSGGIDGIKGERKPSGKREGNAIQEKIKEKEGKIEDLYREIGKEGVSISEEGVPMDTETAKGLIADVKEYEKEITRLKDRVAELDARKADMPEESSASRPEIVSEETAAFEKEIAAPPLEEAMEAAIQIGLSSGAFEFASGKSKFEKIAGDLTDGEIEVKILAAAELGKMKNRAAVPVLAEAVRYEEPSLTLEIVNALIEIGDMSALPLFKDRAGDAHYRVRIACLRGLYKLAADDDGEAMRVLTRALRDEHPEVRKSGATFLGWKGGGEAVPALVQGLKDDDDRVTRAALSALATIRDKSAVIPLIRVLRDNDFEMKKDALDAIKAITGEDVVFDLNAVGAELEKATDELVDWWQKTRLGEAAMDIDAETGEAVLEPEAADVEPEEVVEETRASDAGPEEVIEEPAETDEPRVEPDESEVGPSAVEEEEISGETAPVETAAALSRDELIKKLKSELIAIAGDLGIECDEKLTKAEIADLIVGNDV